ncbi:MAG: magnesium transporter CorA [Candidatus Micrarchaeota archaeon]|nr:magnesium transporter CorA [Candidatus Micrarchaeota archaeon]
MQNSENNGKDAPAPPSLSISTKYKAFCAALLKDGKTEKMEANSPADFKQILSRASVSWVDYLATDFEPEAYEVALPMGFSSGLLATLLTGASKYEDLDNEAGLILPAITVEGFKVTANPLLILIKKNLILTIHGAQVMRFVRLRRYAGTFFRKVPPKAKDADKVTMLLIRIIDENNSRNFDYLREIEEQGDKLSGMLSDPKTLRTTLGPQIYQMKHALIGYLNALWSTVDVLNALRYGDPELLTDNEKLLRRITVLTSDVNNQISLAEHLSEVLASGLEVLQSIYNNQLQILNNKMALLVAYLTVIGTALLVPNTIATVMSNPAFQMGPQDVGWYTALILVSTVVSTVVAYWWVKSRGWMPSSVE